MGIIYQILKLVILSCFLSKQLSFRQKICISRLFSLSLKYNVFFKILAIIFEIYYYFIFKHL